MHDFHDDELRAFEAGGAAPLPPPDGQGYVDNDGARIWWASYGSGTPVVLLHGGLGHSGNWGYQVPALVVAGYRAVLVDSRGHGRSTCDERPFSYALMAGDVIALMDALAIEKAAFAGWSDGACTALTLALRSPARAAGVVFFACNVDPSGTKEFVATEVIDRCFSRHVKDFTELSPNPDRFEAFADAVGLMQRTQPNYGPAELATIAVPVAIVHSEHDEFIELEHSQYMARSIPGAEFILLPGVSHFAPLQRPAAFNRMLLAFLGNLPG